MSMKSNATMLTKRFAAQSKSKNVQLFRTESVPLPILPSARPLKKESVTPSMTLSTVKNVRKSAKMYVTLPTRKNVKLSTGNSATLSTSKSVTQSKSNSARQFRSKSATL